MGANANTNVNGFSSLPKAERIKIITDAKAKGLVITDNGIITKLNTELENYKATIITEISNITVNVGYGEDGVKDLVFTIWLEDSIKYLSPKYMGLKSTNTVNVRANNFANLLTDIGVDSDVEIINLTDSKLAKLTRLLEDCEVVIKSKMINDDEDGYTVFNKVKLSYDEGVAARIERIIIANNSSNNNSLLS